jgi:hypothetical protein
MCPDAPFGLAEASTGVSANSNAMESFSFIESNLSAALIGRAGSTPGFKYPLKGGNWSIDQAFRQRNQGRMRIVSARAEFPSRYFFNPAHLKYLPPLPPPLPVLLPQ